MMSLSERLERFCRGHGQGNLMLPIVISLPRAIERNGQGIAVGRNPIEETVAGIWADVFGMDVGLHDNFFELGGHSLLAMQLLSRVRRDLDLDLSLQALFDAPSVEGMAKSLEAAQRKGNRLQEPAMIPVDREGDLPLSFAQQRLWFLDQLEPRNPAYNMAIAAQLSGHLNVTALESAFNEIVRRHEVLRTRFPAEEGRPKQVIMPYVAQHPSVVNLENLSEKTRDREARRLSTHHALEPFDLAEGPPYRLMLLRMSDTEHSLLLTLHHIAADGWSMDVLFRELSALYEALLSGRSSPLPELPVQYADFAVWQREWAKSKNMGLHLQYWKHQLADAPVRGEVIPHQPRPHVQSYAGASRSFAISDSLAEGLRSLSRKEGVTLFMTLLAAFDVLAYLNTGREDIVIGTNVANRNRLELENLIGFFVNILVLRANLSGNPSFKELMKRVRKMVLEAYIHQDLPFDKLVDQLRPSRDPRHIPWAQVLFVLQHESTETWTLPELTISPFSINRDTSRFDLALFMIETGRHLLGKWTYNTDLFSENTIKQLNQQLQFILRSIVAQPDSDLRHLVWLVRNKDRERLMNESRDPKSLLKKLKSVKPRTVSLPQGDLIKVGPLNSQVDIPLVQPTDEAVDLADWAASNRSFINSLLMEKGAVLFRGFEIASVPRFERFARALCSDLFGDYGDLPREDLGGKVYGSTPYPPDKAILFHNESSHLHRWPMKQWFFSVKAARQGGETPIVDCRRVYQAIDPEIRERFVTEGLLYVRNFTEGLDVSWREMFRTDDRAQVEDYCRTSSIDYEWVGAEGLRIKQRRPAIAKHPTTKETLFFNQILVHHISCLDTDVLESLQSVFADEELPRNVYYGSGLSIEQETVDHLRSVYEALAVTFAWRDGDILMIDNMLVAHGRRPFVGERKVVVAMGDMYEDN